MSAPERDVLAEAVAAHGPFPMPVGEPMPVELTEQQLEALSNAGNRAVNDHFHEDLCFCREWPTSCVSSGNYFMGTWDTSAFDIGLPAVLGVWESLRNDRHAAKIAELRAEVDRLREQVAELEARPAPAAVLRTVADEWSAQCPDHSEADEVWMSCPGEWVYELHLVADAFEAGVRTAPAPVEDPHNSPLHHTYALGHDLPEVTP